MVIIVAVIRKGAIRNIVVLTTLTCPGSHHRCDRLALAVLVPPCEVGGQAVDSIGILSRSAESRSSSSLIGAVVPTHDAVAVALKRLYLIVQSRTVEGVIDGAVRW